MAISLSPPPPPSPPLVDFNAGKTQLNSFEQSNNDVKMNGYFLEQKSSFKITGLSFFSKMEWGYHNVSIAKTASKKIGDLTYSNKFLSPKVALYLFKFIIRPCTECCCHVSDDAIWIC